jgi:DNA-directed RNA polymerase specialized sigma24 family protein
MMTTLINDLWSEHRTRLRGYIAKRVREDDAVDDILQDVFLKASENLHSLKSRGSVAAWLYRIAANAMCSCKTRNRRTCVAGVVSPISSRKIVPL